MLQPEARVDTTSDKRRDLQQEATTRLMQSVNQKQSRGRTRNEKCFAIDAGCESDELQRRISGKGTKALPEGQK